MTRFVILVALAACTRTASQTPSPAPPAPPASQPRQPGPEHREVDKTASRGIPPGYAGRTDDSRRNIREVLYRRIKRRFEIQTGPSHIMYAPGDTMAGSYIVATTFHQTQAPVHPEAFGLFIGGSALDGPGQRYSYFVVRGTGEYAVKTRDGETVQVVIPWTAHPSVPRQNASGQARYRLAIDVGTDSIRFLSGGHRLASVARTAMPSEGVFGIRVNHNLRLTVDEVRRSAR